MVFIFLSSVFWFLSSVRVSPCDKNVRNIFELRTRPEEWRGDDSLTDLHLTRAQFDISFGGHSQQDAWNKVGYHRGIIQKTVI